MFRKDLIGLLARPRTLKELAHQLGVRPLDVEDDLKHLHKSLKHTPHQWIVEPAACRKCGFTFSADKLKKPGKCPRCHGTWIQAPTICIRPR